MQSVTSKQRKAMRRRTAMILALVTWLAGAGFAAAAEPSRPNATATVARVLDGDTVELADGRVLRLAGIRAAKVPMGHAAGEGWPLADAATAALRRLARGRRLSLAFPARRVDRHGRIVAQAGLPDGTWLQDALLRRGLARVNTTTDTVARSEAMLAMERDARQAGRGIWAHPRYRVRTRHEVRAHIGSFQIVRAKVRDVARVRGRVYLNFGQDWREDFTVSLTPSVRRRFESAGVDVESYKGRIVRVRGWVESYNGPIIAVTHPQQIEVVR